MSSFSPSSFLSLFDPPSCIPSFDRPSQSRTSQSNNFDLLFDLNCVNDANIINNNNNSGSLNDATRTRTNHEQFFPVANQTKSPPIRQSHSQSILSSSTSTGNRRTSPPSEPGSSSPHSPSMNDANSMPFLDLPSLTSWMSNLFNDDDSNNNSSKSNSHNRRKSELSTKSSASQSNNQTKNISSTQKLKEFDQRRALTTTTTTSRASPASLLTTGTSKKKLLHVRQLPIDSIEINTENFKKPIIKNNEINQNNDQNKSSSNTTSEVKSDANEILSQSLPPVEIIPTLCDSTSSQPIHLQISRNPDIETSNKETKSKTTSDDEKLNILKKSDTAASNDSISLESPNILDVALRDSNLDYFSIDSSMVVVDAADAIITNSAPNQWSDSDSNDDWDNDIMELNEENNNNSDVNDIIDLELLTSQRLQSRVSSIPVDDDWQIMRAEEIDSDNNSEEEFQILTREETK